MLRVIGSLLLISLNLFAFVEATLSSNNITLGERVTLTLSASGQNVIFPELLDIAGFEIESTAKSQNISIINGKQSIKISKSLTFTPTKSLKITPFEIEVNGVKEKTKELNLKIVKSKPTSKNSKFTFEVKVDKKEAYVGEPIKYTILFKRAIKEDVLDIEYSQINFPNFWSKQVGKENAYREDSYIVHKLNFILFPQKAGKIKIAPSKLRVATPKRSRDIFGFWVKSPHWRTIFSNELSFNIKPIPDNINLVGDFKIEADIDKSSVKENDPINLTLKISGIGNFDALEEFNLNLDGAIVYADKSQKNYKFVGDDYSGNYSKKFALIAEKNFIIPSFTLKYFDLKTKTVKEIKTKEFSISVEAKRKLETKLETLEAKVETETEIETKIEHKELKIISNIDKLIYIMFGFFLGIIFILIIKFVKIDFSKFKEVKFSLKDRDLLKLLIPFASKNTQAKEIVLKLEENIYYGKKHKISKKEITKLLNEIN